MKYHLTFNYLASGNIYFAGPCGVLQIPDEFGVRDTVPFEDALATAITHLQKEREFTQESSPVSGSHPATFAGHVARLAHAIQHSTGLLGLTAPGWFELSSDKTLGVFSCVDQATGQAAAALAVSILTDRPYSIRDKLAKRVLEAIEPWTTPLAQAARARGIPISVVAASERPFLALGHGVKRQIFWKNFTQNTSYIATRLSTRKDITSRLLREAGLPAPRNVAVADAQSAVRAAESFGYPVVVKPAATDFGRGVTVDNQTSEQVYKAFQYAAKWGQVIVEQQIFGHNHRLLIVHGCCIRVMRTFPASVTGDGKRTISELVNVNNLDRKDGLTAGFRITLDDQAEEVLARQGLMPSSIPANGQIVVVSGNSNRRNGASAELVTELAHPEVLDLGVKAAALLGIDVAGIDYITSDITLSPKETGGAICEVNVTPGLISQEEVTLAQIDPFFPRECNGRIPTVCVVTKAEHSENLNNGLRALMGPNVSCSDSVQFWGENQGASLPRRTQAIMTDPLASVALITCSSDDFKTFGLGIDRCSLAVIEEWVSQEILVVLLRIASKIVMPFDLYQTFAAEISLAERNDSIWLVGVDEETCTRGSAGWVRTTEQGKIEINLGSGTTSFVDRVSPSRRDEVLAAVGAALGVDLSRIIESFSLS